MKVSVAIASKRAVRNFKRESLAEKEVRAILNAGRRAQSSKNRQAWQFIAVQDNDILKKVSKGGAFAGHLKGAAMGVIILTPPPEEFYGALFDAGQSAAYMQLAAWELGIASCLATLYKTNKVRDILNIPDNWQPLMAISFGYPLSKQKPKLRLIKAGRKDFEDVVHWEEW